jgi:transcriptional regulator with XRE-family HTH domain
MEKPIFSANQQVLLLLLREIRQKAGLRQVDLAAKLRRHQSFVSKYESGERRLDILELRHICGILGISLVEFARQLESRLRGRR